MLNSPSAQTLRDEGKFGYVAYNLLYREGTDYNLYICVDIYNNYHFHVKDHYERKFSLEERSLIVNELAKHFKEEWDRDYIMTTCPVAWERDNLYLEQLGFEWVGYHEDPSLGVPFNIYKLEYREVH